MKACRGEFACARLLGMNRLFFPIAALLVFVSASSCWGGIGVIQTRISPDGEWIAGSYQGAIVKFPASGGEMSVLTEAEGWDVEPAWSPDGKKIAFFRSPHFVGGRLFVIDSETGKDIPLPNPIHGYGKIFWHAEQNKMLGLLKAQAPRKLSWLDLDSGETTEVNLEAEIEDQRRQGLSWALSPDSREILWAIHADQLDQQSGRYGPGAALSRCQADGSNNRKVVDWPARIYNLEWDAGTRHAFAVTDRGTTHNDVWKIDLETKPLRNSYKLTFGQADEERPSVSRKVGGPLVYTTNQSGSTEVIRVDLASGTHIPLSLEPPAYDGRLRIKIADGGVVRLSVKRKGGNFFAPPGSLYRLTGVLGHFYSNGCDFVLPSGDYEILATRGLEFEPTKLEITVGADTEVEIKPKRWVNLGERGWFSGENHVHANYGYGEWYNTPDTILRQCQGEDLNVCNAVIGNSDGDAVFDREFFLGRLDPVSTPTNIVYWNQEFRSTFWGHLTLSRLTSLTEPIFTGFDATTNPYDVPTNADIAATTRERGGIVSYTHPASNALDLYDQAYAAKGSPVDVALGRIDALDIAGNTYPGSIQLWYHFLNCGFDVVASAGTDCFLNRVRSYPPGWARCYAYLDDELTYDGWIDAQVKGRSFITNGPVVFLEVDGQKPGSSITLENSGKVRVKAEALSYFPMEKVELVFNGEVIQQLPVGNGTKLSFEGEIEIPQSGWLALRAEGPQNRLIFGRGMSAHTNVVRFEVGDNPWRSADSARYFLKWIDRLEADFDDHGRLPDPRRRAGVLAQLEAAREVYRKVIESAH
jgi:hypothetical protein